MTNQNTDYYDILNVSKDASQYDIKFAFREKLRQYHPDKIKQTPENKKMYKMIREAGEILTDKQRRKAYDLEKTCQVYPKDIDIYKKHFDEFIQLQSNASDCMKKLKVDALPPTMTKEEHDRRYDDMLMQREFEETELNNKNIFGGRQFNTNEFNKVFEKKNMNKNNVKIEELDAYNDNVQTDLCAPIINNDETASNDDNISNCSDELSIDSIEDNTYKCDIEKITQHTINERKNQDETIKKLKDTEYGSALDDKFGVSNGLGILVGNNMFGNQINTNKNNRLSKKVIDE